MRAIALTRDIRCEHLRTGAEMPHDPCFAAWSASLVRGEVARVSARQCRRSELDLGFH
jgi:hypothetical protein